MKTIYLLSIRETISESWLKLSGAKGTFWAAYLVSILIFIGIAILAGLGKFISPLLSILIGGIAQFVNVLLQLGILYIGIQRAFDKPINYKQLFRTLQKDITLKIIGLFILKFLIYFCVFLIIFIPTIFFTTLDTLAGINMTGTNIGKLITAATYLISILLVIYFYTRLFLASAFVLDRELNPWLAIKSSFTATRSNIWRIIGIIIISILLLVIGAIPLGIGLIWTFPLVFIILGVTYKKLLVNMNG